MYVLMVVPSNFPNGDAGAVRDMAFAYIYQELGYEVYLIGAGRGDREGDFNGVHYYSLHKEANTTVDHIRRFLCLSKQYTDLIELVISKNGKPSVIHINSIPEKAINFLIRIAKKYDVPMIHDSTEWYSPCEFVHGRLDKAYILKDRLNKRIIRRPIKVIGISTYLTEHFVSRGLKSVRIPVIMDIKNTSISVNASEKIKLIYAGNPANKDYLKEIVLGASLLSRDLQDKLELHILGANEEQIMNLAGIKKLPDCIKAYGRVPREKVEDVMKSMDFSVLLRPSEERYTKAGFPTKSVEAMAHGVAMICNLSSDLGIYLKDGRNAILVKGYNEQSFSKSLEYVLTLNRKEIDNIKKEARRTADSNFDYRIWVPIVKDFISQ